MEPPTSYVCCEQIQKSLNHVLEWQIHGPQMGIMSDTTSDRYNMGLPSEYHACHCHYKPTARYQRSGTTMGFGMSTTNFSTGLLNVCATTLASSTMIQTATYYYS